MSQYKNLLFTAGVNFGQAEALKRVISRLEGILHAHDAGACEAHLGALNELVINEKKIIDESARLSTQQQVAAAEIAPRAKPLLSQRIKRAIIGAIDGWTGESEG